MGFFHVPDDRSLFHGDSDLQTWPESKPTGYRLFTGGNSGEEKIGIEVKQEIELALVVDAMQVFSSLHSSNLAAVVPGIVGSPTAKPVRIKLTAKAAGVADIIAKNDSGETIASLKVVAGHFENHTNMEVDLIAEVCQGSDPLKIHGLQRMLHNNFDNPFNQKTPANRHKKFGDMACGIVAKYRGEEIFGFMGKVEYDHPYHEPIWSSPITDRKQVKYKPEKILSIGTHIGQMLREHKPVRVGVLDSPIGMTTINGGIIAYHAGGHSVLIVGANKANTQFMYIDPWYGGSKMQYKGGIANNKFSEECEYIGLFDTEYDPDRRLKATDIRKNIIRESTTTEGTFTRADGNYLEVEAGPWLIK
jgi:hypothetical protein